MTNSENIRDDFGGGTLDLAVLNARNLDLNICSVHGIALGGDLLDQLIYRTKLFPEFGEGVHVPGTNFLRGGTMKFPFGRFAEGLLNWQRTYLLNTPELRSLLALRYKGSSNAKAKLDRLHDLITGNYAYMVFQAIERAKIILSDKHRTEILIPELGIAVSLNRKELATILREQMHSIREAINEVLRRANLSRNAIGIVVRTGGSSQIPAVKTMLRKLFPGRVVEHDLFTSIAAGLAIANYRGLGYHT